MAGNSEDSGPTVRLEEQPFRYSPLVSFRNEIRVLRLIGSSLARPVTLNDIPICDISSISLDQISECPYAAVSYVWGNPEPTQRIIVNGHSMLIAENLYSFLRHAQCHHNMVLWIDALCINQQDIAERNLQIQKMKTIFDSAVTVIAWLGTCKDIACEASGHELGHAGLRWLDTFGEEVRAVKDDSKPPSLKRRLKEQFESQIVPWESVIEIWESPIWTRAWCVQELAREVVSIFKGPHFDKTTKLWANLHAAYLFVYYEKSVKSLRTADSQVWPATSRLFFAAHAFFPLFSSSTITIAENESPTTSLIDWLWVSRQFLHATDPRDRIFAIISLIKDTGEFNVVPDYNVSCKQVYIDVARALYAQGTIVLYHAIIGSKQRSLPSFVPDWSCKLPKTSILGSNEQIFGGNFHAGGHSVSNVVISPDGTQMQVSGIVVGSIAFIADEEPVPDGLDDGVQQIDMLLIWAYSCVRRIAMVEVVYQEYFLKPRANPGVYHTAAEVEMALVHSATAFAYSRDSGPGTAASTEKADINMVLSGYRFWKDPNLDLMPSDIPEAFLETPPVKFLPFLSVVSQRRPFISSKGYIGLGPGDLQVGDLVCILLGFEVPVILRQIFDGVYTIINEAYVYGIMQGEFLEGDAVPNVQTFTIQ